MVGTSEPSNFFFFSHLTNFFGTTHPARAACVIPARFNLPRPQDHKIVGQQQAGQRLVQQ